MMDSWVTQLRKGLIEYGVLAALRQGESYGYEIVQTLRRMEILSVSESTLYPVLARLREEKLLKTRDVPSPEGPPRRYFALTALGKVRLAEMNAYWDLLNEEMGELRTGGTGRP
jgi:PadR family transcriptional regulator PadR